MDKSLNIFVERPILGSGMKTSASTWTCEGEQAVYNPLTSGSVGRAVWTLAWPTILSNVFQTAYGFINMLFVGSVGTSAIAAVGFGNTVLFVQMSALMGVSVGTTALVARFYGAKMQSEADEVTRQSILLALFVSIATGLIVVISSDPILLLLDVKPDVLPIAAKYLRIVAAATPLFFMGMVILSALRGAGDVRMPLLIMGVQVGLNVLLDWLLIFGVGPFPALGVAGAAYATVISRALGLGLAFFFLSRSTLAGSLRGSWRPVGRWFSRILHVGIPAAVQGFLRTGGFFAYYGIIGRTAEATAAVAALTIGMQAESLAFMPGMSFGIAASSLVGQNLGAKNPARARRSGWHSALQGMIIMSLMGVLFYVFAEGFSRLFNNDPVVVALSASYLRINAFSEPFLALAMILTGALQGAGQTRFPAIITFVTMWVLRIPLTWYLAIGWNLGAVGGWITMALTTVVAGILTTVYFKLGNWQKTEV
jgi:putative MATE family efflux protein